MRRAGLVASAGAVLGSAVLAVSAQAATFTVTTTGDAPAGACGPTCTLRDAIAGANSTAGDDTIDFSSGLSGTIRLTQGALSIAPANSADKLTITGPGASGLAVSGDFNGDGVPDAGDSQVLTIGQSGDVSISGLTLTDGFSSTHHGGAVEVTNNGVLTLTNDAVTNSDTTYASGNLGGGGISTNGQLTLDGTTVSGNTAPAAIGGGINSAYGDLKISNSTISGNTALGGGGLRQIGFATITNSLVTGNDATGSPSLYGGGGIDNESSLNISGSTVSGNVSAGPGGGILSRSKYNFAVSDSSISGNTAPTGGGLAISAASPKYTSISLVESTVSGNHGAHGAGIQIADVARGDRVTINRSTIWGNQGGPGSFGGGILVDGDLSGTFDVLDSTISGNAASAGGGVSLGSDTNTTFFPTYNGSPTGAVDFDNSTIASNAATGHGGGIYLSEYGSGSPTVQKSGSANIDSTIVAGNAAAGAASDLTRVATSTSGGFDSAFSLIQQPGSAPLTKQSTIVGADPKLGALANNGGPTLTQLPAGTSPVIDQGRAPQNLGVDQRNQPRTVGTALPDRPGGDGTDIGAVELPASSVFIPQAPPVVAPPPAPTATFSVFVRGVPLGGAHTPLLVAGSTPVDCSISFGTMSSCVIEVRALSGGALLASGEVTSTAHAAVLATTVTLTSRGQSLLKAAPIGVDASAFALGGTSSSPTATGKVHLLGGPSITLALGTRSTKLSKAVVAQLKQIAGLLVGAKTVRCTAYTNAGKGDVALTKTQARAACADLVKDGLKSKVVSVGKGHASPIASNRTHKGMTANRRLVITFSF